MSTELTPFVNDKLTVLDQARAVLDTRQIDSQPAAQQAVLDIAWLEAQATELRERVKDEIAEHYAVIADRRSAIRPAVEFATDLAQGLRAKLSAYESARERAHLAAEAHARATGDVTALVASQVAGQDDVTGASFRTDYSAQPTILALIPAKYWKVDVGAATADMKASAKANGGPPTPIPGFEVVTKKVPVIRKLKVQT